MKCKMKKIAPKPKEQSILYPTKPVGKTKKHGYHRKFRLANIYIAQSISKDNLIANCQRIKNECAVCFNTGTEGGFGKFHYHKRYEHRAQRNRPDRKGRRDYKRK